jgi:hypothetical protein
MAWLRRLYQNLGLQARAPAALACALLWFQTTLTLAEPDVPAHNRADQRVAPPRPAADDVEDKLHKLLAAIAHDDPQLADEAFFPRPPFLLIKDIADPGRYYDQLRQRFATDIHALHARIPNAERASYERFELSARGAFVRVHEEGNRLPYWAARHSFLYFRCGDKLEKIEIRVLISWDDHWYVIHLSEFH